MKIVSWNVAGLRSMIKKQEFHEFINDYYSEVPDIICLQETKAMREQVNLDEYILEKYPYMYWNSTDGTTQRKGLSGTTIWSKIKPIQYLDTPEFDNEGRIIALEFEKFILVNVYVPNSQKLENDRYYFREKWNKLFINYIKDLRENKEVIICGDFNVAHNPIDISNPKAKKNKVPGFFDNERGDFENLLNINQLVDVFRNKNQDKQESTYWSNFLKAERSELNGWRIDYFLVAKKLYDYTSSSIEILKTIKGSDHCPIVLDINI